MDAALRALRATFGHDGFREGQREIIGALLAGDDVLALMPTGAGKSLLYQLPAMIGLGPVLVVSPLISLMRDQIVALRAKGVAAAALNSGNEPEENAATFDMIAQRRIRLLYIAPERLVLDETIDMLTRLKPRLLAVDEAHCVSRWGHDFRPDYARIGEIAKRIGSPRTIAVTATAGPRTRADIQSMLFLRTPRIFVRSFRRPNIAISVRRRGQILKDVGAVIRAHRGQSGIVYCGSRAATESLARALAANGVPALAYHAGMDAAARSSHQDEFLARPDGVMVATIAFGMGIDKENVRFVCHADLPRSIEAFYQEIGRAGRDGLPAQAIALAPHRAWNFHPEIESSSALDERAEDMSAMLALARTFDCRWRELLSHLGEEAGPCGVCDNCRSGFAAMRGVDSFPRRIAAAVRGAFLSAFDRRLASKQTDDGDGDAAPDSFSTFDKCDAPALTVEELRLLARLKAARRDIARQSRIAPAELAREEALFALARLANCDPQRIPEQAGAILKEYDPASARLVEIVVAAAEDSRR
jgi:ATP-dependent DNA helicase RecQ